MRNSFITVYKLYNCFQALATSKNQYFVNTKCNFCDGFLNSGTLTLMMQ